MSKYNQIFNNSGLDTKLSVKMKADIDAFERHLVAQRRSKETIKSYVRSVKQFYNVIKKELNEIKDEDLDKFRFWCNETMAYDVNSLTPKYYGINAFFKFKKIPFELHAPRKVVKQKKPLTQEEIYLMFEKSDTNLRDNAILKTFYFSQLRKSELINLNLDDIDFQRQKIIVRSGKGNTYDTINIHKDALIAIKKYYTIRSEKGDKEALFKSNTGNRIGKTAIDHLIKKYAKMCRIDKRVYPHLFRITSITHMAENGIQIESIRQQSRHKDYKTLQSYIQLSDQKIREDYENGLTLDKPKNKELPPYNGQNMTQNNRAEVTSNTYTLLAEQYAKGAFTTEQFLRVIESLKQEEELRINPSYS